MKRAAALLVLVLVGCASGTSIPAQIPATMKAACDLYVKAKPDVIAAQAYATAHWNDKVPGTDRDLIPAEVKTTLTKLNGYLPELDRAGQLLCAASTTLETVTSTNPGGKVNWDEVLSTVVKGVALGIQLKQQGAF